MFKKCKKFCIAPSVCPDPSSLFYHGSGHILFSVLIGACVTTLSGCERLPSSPMSAPPTSNNELIINKPIVATALPKPTQQLTCEQLQAGRVVTIAGHTAIEPQCDLTDKGVQFVLDSSDTSLDCNGARLSANEAAANKSAITIRPKADKAIKDITVANCHIQGYGHALHIRQKTNPNERYVKGMTNPEANRALAPYNIRIINVTSNGSKNSGIFVGDHVHHVSFDQLQVARSGTVGLYLEFGSQHNTIQNSVFVDNGFRAFKPNREAIAVDSSAFNTIKNNKFIHNGAGSIYLYRNCFEHANDPSRSNYFKRTESASDNIIVGNTFSDEPVGIWVASRQSRNLKGFECGAYPLAKTAFASYYIDSAKHNLVKDNTFVGVESGIIVEDDGTQISGNDFSKVGGVAIKVGSEIRERYASDQKGEQAGLHAGIQHTVIHSNVFDATQSRDDQVRISKASQQGTQFK